MEFNFSTFALEIINFLVLLWILQRLFYKPLLTIIAKRKQSIDEQLRDAERMMQQANEQRELYENRQKLWQQEKQIAIKNLQQQLDNERARQMEKLQADLDLERQKLTVSLLRHQQAMQLQYEKHAIKNGAHFAGTLLKHAAGPELEARLFNLLLDRLSTLPESCRQFLQSSTGKHVLIIKVTSAFGLSVEQQIKLEQKFAGLVSSPFNFQYAQHKELIAGLRLDIGAWVLNVNVQHELIGFAELANHVE